MRIPADFICQEAPSLTGTLKGDKVYPGVFDNSKLKRFVPEFQCRKSFRVGVRESVAWLGPIPSSRTSEPEVEAMMDKVVAAWRGRGHASLTQRCGTSAGPDSGLTAGTWEAT